MTILDRIAQDERRRARKVSAFLGLLLGAAALSIAGLMLWFVVS